VKTLRGIVSYTTGDFAAKTLNFLAFVYLVRVLGAASYGAVELAGAILSYFAVLADGGLEVWATREVAAGRSIPALAARIISLRLVTAIVAFAGLIVLIPLVPDEANVRAILLLYGSTLFAQALNLKWVCVGQQQMSRAAQGVVLGQLVFLLATVMLVRDASQVMWIPLMRLLSEMGMVIYFARLYLIQKNGFPLEFSLRGASELLRPALAIGSANIMGLAGYNLDFILLGLMRGPAVVAIYAVAYKPVIAI
jgi:O-antigen/teichoic acid export membrane protein